MIEELAVYCNVKLLKNREGKGGGAPGRSFDRCALPRFRAGRRKPRGRRQKRTSRLVER